MTNKLNKKFEEFGSIPNPEVWERIEVALNTQKRKKRLLWIFLPGAAAGLIALLFLAVLPSGKSLHAGNHPKQDHKVVKPSDPTDIHAHKKMRKTGKSSVSDPDANQRNPGINHKTHTKKKAVLYDGSTDLPANPGNPDRSSASTGAHTNKENPEKSSVSADTITPLAETTLTEAKPGDTTKIDSTLAANELISETKQAEIKKDSLAKASRWSLSLQAGAWDAFDNRVLVNSTSETVYTSDPGVSSLVPQPQTSSATNTDTVSISKPLSLRANVAFTGKKGFVYTAGINFDRQDARYNSKETRFMSTGMNLGFGKNFPLSPRFSLAPFALVNYDRFVHEKTNAAPALSALNAIAFSGSQVSVQLEVHAIFHLTEKHAFYLSPATKYYLHQSLTTSNGPVLKRDWWNGLHLGWKYTF